MPVGPLSALSPRVMMKRAPRAPLARPAGTLMMREKLPFVVPSGTAKLVITFSSLLSVPLPFQSIQPFTRALVLPASVLVAVKFSVAFAPEVIAGRVKPFSSSMPLTSSAVAVEFMDPISPSMDAPRRSDSLMDVLASPKPLKSPWSRFSWHQSNSRLPPQMVLLEMLFTKDSLTALAVSTS